MPAKKNFRSEICLESLEVREEIIHGQLDIKHKHFMEEVLSAILKRIKSTKAADIDEILPELWETRKFDVKLLRLYSALRR